MRVLELFCGIGGVAAALGGAADVVAAVDHDRRALQVYSRNFDHAVRVMNLTGGRDASIPDADLWWMSPPCQPYTIRGRQRDLDDRRSAAFVRVVRVLAERRPRYVALENVPWFEGSDGHGLLREALAGYEVRERMLCPTELGVPNVRRRFYLVAGREGLAPVPEDRQVGLPLVSYLDAEPDPDLDVEPELLERFGDALHVVEPGDASTACFTSAYGRSPVYAGSYLRAGRLRRFSPREILALLHFPAAYELPPLDRARAWPLVGNTVSVAAVRQVLASIPELGVALLSPAAGPVPS